MRLSLSAILAWSSTASAALKYKGVDWSSVIVEEKAGVSYKNINGQVQPIEKIFADNGVNTVRQRIWVTPKGGDYDLDYNIKLAKRAKAVGLGVYVDFHYSDTWAGKSGCCPLGKSVLTRQQRSCAPNYPVRLVDRYQQPRMEAVQLYA